jgi:hypothetical protein
VKSPRPATRFICEWCNDNFPIEEQCSCTACPSCCICTPKKVNETKYAFPLPHDEDAEQESA